MRNLAPIAAASHAFFAWIQRIAGQVTLKKQKVVLLICFEGGKNTHILETETSSVEIKIVILQTSQIIGIIIL
jgi:hypothetical protein